MTAVRLDNVNGIAPKLDPRTLPPNMAQAAENCRMFSGGIDPYLQPFAVATPTKADLGTVLSIYPLRDGETLYWLNWLKEVDVARASIPDDGSQRIYYTGDGEPRVTNFALATVIADYPATAHVLGVPAPLAAPTVGHTGGSGANETRAYVYTFVTAWGEEGRPSPPTVYTAPANATSWNISGMATTLPNAGTVTNAQIAGASVVEVTLNTLDFLRVGEEIEFTGVGGMTDLNGKHAIVALLSGNRVSVALATSQTYTSGGTWERVATHNTTNMVKRIYRSDTVRAYRLVAEIPIGTASYNDSIANTALSSLTLPSEDYYPPPTDLKKLIALPNGCLAGLSGNDLCLSMPNRPHAWPIKYRFTMASEGVSIAAVGASVVVATRGAPYVATGRSPDSFALDGVDALQESGLAARGMATVPQGALYPSKNGLVLIGPGVAQLATPDILTEREMARFNPDTLLAIGHQNRYFAWFTKGEESGGLVFDLSGQSPRLVTMSVYATAAHVDRETGKLYIVVANQIMLWEGDNNNRLPYHWLGRINRLDKPTNFGSAKVVANYVDIEDAEAAIAQMALDAEYNQILLDAADPAYGGQDKLRGCWDGGMFNEFAFNDSLLRGEGGLGGVDARSITFRLWVRDYPSDNMVIAHEENVRSDEPFRLPGGYTSDEFAVELNGNIRYVRTEMAETMTELERA
jgi:hypothetical protein